MPDKLKFELSFFEDLLHNELAPQRIGQTVETTSVASLKPAMELEARRICRALRDMTYRPVAEELIERCVQGHQRDITLMMDQVYGLMGVEGERDNGLCPGSMELYLHLKACLRQVLGYIEFDLGRYFDLEQRVPLRFRLSSASQLQQDGNLLLARMRAKEIDQHLQGLIMAYFREHTGTKDCSYAQQRYAKLVMDSLLRALEGQGPRDWDRRMVVELIYLNFNKASFFIWCRRYIATEVESQLGIPAQSERLVWFLKEIEPIDCKPNVCYKAGRPKISALLQGYVTSEMAYLMDCAEQNPTAPVTDLKERAERFDFKLPLNLSVEQLALFVELFIRSGVFPVEKGAMMKTMEFFAANVSTKGTSSMSAQSLNNKRKPEGRTVGWMREMLHQMLAVLDEVAGE